MVKAVVGGVIAMVIGGSTYAVSQSDVVNNFSKNTGQSQQQAQQYINSIPQKDLQSFSKIGQGFVSDGNSLLNDSTNTDCVNYTYKWVTDSLSCDDGKTQLQTVGNDEITLGNCFQALDTNLGNTSKDKISQCISAINATDADYNLPVIIAVLDSNTITDSKNTDAYNKSVLEAALKSN
jgi:hypothetical protein